MRSEAPTLASNQIEKAGSIDEWKTLFENNDYHFKLEEDLLRSIKRNWENYREEKLNFIKVKETPNVKPLEVIVNGSKHGILGIVHLKLLEDKYKSLVSGAMSSDENWLYEQKMSKFFDVPDNSIELPDHLIGVAPQLLKGSFRNGLLTTIFSLPGFIFKHLGRNFYNSLIEDKTNTAINMLNTPELWFPGLPPNVDVELQERGEPVKYKPRTSRSAYMAEFMKTWKPKEDKNILVGFMHAPEIKYFLENGVKDSEIVETAQRHSELLQQDPQKFARLVLYSKTKSGVICWTGFSSGMAVPLGVAYGLYELFS